MNYIQNINGIIVYLINDSIIPPKKSSNITWIIRVIFINLKFLRKMLEFFGCVDNLCLDSLCCRYRILFDEFIVLL